MRAALLVLALLVLSGCRSVDVQVEPTGQVFLPFVPQGEAMCTKLCRHVAMIDAQTRCEAEMWRLRIEELRVRMPDDCWGDNLLPFMEAQ